MSEFMECTGKKVDQSDEDITWIHFKAAVFDDLNEKIRDISFEIPVKTENNEYFKINEKYTLSFERILP